MKSHAVWFLLVINRLNCTTDEIKFFHCNKNYFSDFLSRSSGGRSGGRLPDRDAPPGSGGGTGPDRDRENFSRWRERQYFGPRKWLESALTYSSYEKDTGNYFFTSFVCRPHINLLLLRILLAVLQLNFKYNLTKPHAMV